MALKKQAGRNNNGRSKHNNNKYGNQHSHRNRNTYKQHLERYLNLAKDAAANGDHITAEGYRQHAEYYLRQLNELSPFEHKKPSHVSSQNPQGEEGLTLEKDPSHPDYKESSSDPIEIDLDQEVRERSSDT